MQVSLDINGYFEIIIKCLDTLRPLLSVLIMKVSLFLRVTINRFHCRLFMSGIIIMVNVKMVREIIPLSGMQVVLVLDDCKR